MAESDTYRPDYSQHYGGWRTSEVPTELGIQESPDLLNVRPLGLGMYGPRNGTEAIGNLLSSEEVLGEELIDNPDFSEGSGGAENWFYDPTKWTWPGDGGGIDHIPGSGKADTLSSDCDTIPDTTLIYRFTLTMKEWADGTITIATDSGSPQTFGPADVAEGVITGILTGPGLTNKLVVNVSDDFNSGFSFVSLKRIIAPAGEAGRDPTRSLHNFRRLGGLGPELVRNGNVATNANFWKKAEADGSGEEDIGSQPIEALYGWYWANGQMNYVQGQEEATMVLQDVPVAAGVTYQIKITVGGDQGQVTVSLGLSGSVNILAGTEATVNVLEAANNGYIRIIAGQNGGLWFNGGVTDISVREVIGGTTVGEMLVRSWGTTLEYLDDFTVSGLVTPTWTAVPGIPEYAQDREFGFAHDQQLLYYGNGIQNFSTWDGNITHDITEYSGNPKGNIYALYLLRLLIAGDPNAPATIYYSKTANTTDFTFSSPRNPDDGGALTIGDGGDPITSLKTLITPDGNSSVIVTKRSTRIYEMTIAEDGTPALKELKTGTGSINDRGTVIVENDIFYPEEHNHFQSLGLKQEVLFDLSKTQASNVIDDRTPDYNFDKICGFYFTRQKFAIWSFKDFGSAVNDTQLVYYTKFNSWWRWKGLAANQFEDYKGQLVWASSVNTAVYGLTGGFDDTGNAIQSYRSTRDEDVSSLKHRGTPLGLAGRFKKARYWVVMGYIAPGARIDFTLMFNADPNQTMVRTVHGTDAVVSEGVTTTLGRVVVGRDLFGGAPASAEAFPMRFFLARISYEAYGFLFCRFTPEVNGAGMPYIITHMIPWMEIMPDNYWPDDNKI